MTAAKILLQAGEHDERRNAEKIAGLVAIGIGAEVADIMPERERGLPQMEHGAERGERNHAARKNARREPDVAAFSLESGDVIKPRQARDQGEAAFERQPWLHAERGGKREPKVIR